MRSVGIVTDSTSDVPEEVARALDIEVVPAYVQMREESLRDREELGREDFYAALPHLEELPTTAAPPIDDFVRAFRRCADRAESVVAVFVSEKLSSICDAARIAARQIPGLSIQVLDSGQVSMGLGWQVIAAAEAAAAGLGVTEIVSRVEQVRSHSLVLAVLDTLEYVHRSGRVGWAAREASRLLRIKPILSVGDGVVSSIGRSRTRARSIGQLIARTKEAGPIRRLAVLHTMAPEVSDFSAALSEEVGVSVEHTVLVTTAIGAHVGPRGLGVAAVVAG